MSVNEIDEVAISQREQVGALLAQHAQDIRANLNRGNASLARVAKSLVEARLAIRAAHPRGITDWSFEEWYASFGISKYVASRWIRWIEPFVDQIDWESDDDPILSELVKVGPCKCSEARKADGYYRLNEDGKLVIEYDGEVYTLSEMNHDEVEDLCQIIKNRPADGESETVEVAGIDAVDDLVTETGGASPESEIDDEPLADDDGEEDDVADVIVETQASNEVAAESGIWEWSSEPSRASLTVTSGKLGATVGGACIPNGAKVYAINAVLHGGEQDLSPAPVNETEDAFCVVRSAGEEIVLWWDRIQNRWNKMVKQQPAFNAAA